MKTLLPVLVLFAFACATTPATVSPAAPPTAPSTVAAPPCNAGLPLIDAFGRPLAIEQIWLPDLSINYNFREVARFDRCTTCHQGIDKTAAGAPSEPAYLPESTMTLQMATPGRAPEVDWQDAESRQRTLLQAYGFKRAEKGILDPAEVPALVESGKIRHSLVLVGLYYFDLWQRGVGA